ncbi:MAG: DUF3344 domain-containing protein [Promethearchaeia archaeon]
MYNFEGFSLEPRIYGKIHGGIFISVGNKYGLDSTPYDISYNVPNGTKILYSILYIYIWGGSEYNSGTIELTVNNKKIGENNLNGINDNNENVLISTHGSYSVFYVLTNDIILNKVNNISITTEGSSFDGRVYGAVLLVVYEVQNQIIKFCFADGNEGLHYSIKGDTYDTCTMTFPDSYDKTEFLSSELWISYIAGNSGESDYLYFNNQLLGSDVADQSLGLGIDFECFNVTDSIEEKNQIEVKRGEESYLHPMNTLLVSKYKTGFGNDTNDYLIINQREFTESSENVLDNPQFEQLFWVVAIIGIIIVVFSFQFIRKRKFEKRKLLPIEEKTSADNLDKEIHKNKYKQHEYTKTITNWTKELELIDDDYKLEKKDKKKDVEP